MGTPKTLGSPQHPEMLGDPPMGTAETLEVGAPCPFPQHLEAVATPSEPRYLGDPWDPQHSLGQVPDQHPPPPLFPPLGGHAPPNGEKWDPSPSPPLRVSCPHWREAGVGCGDHRVPRDRAAPGDIVGEGKRGVLPRVPRGPAPTAKPPPPPPMSWGLSPPPAGRPRLRRGARLRRRALAVAGPPGAAPAVRGFQPRLRPLPRGGTAIRAPDSAHFCPQAGAKWGPCPPPLRSRSPGEVSALSPFFFPNLFLFLEGEIFLGERTNNNE